VIVDDIENDGDAMMVRFIHEVAELVRRSIEARGGEEIDPVVTREGTDVHFIDDLPVKSCPGPRGVRPMKPRRVDDA
jgi:hypothetical protein